MSLISELQKPTKANKLFSYLGGALMSSQEQNDRHIIWSDISLDPVSYTHLDVYKRQA